LRQWSGWTHHAVNESWDLVIVDRSLPGGVDGLSIVGKLRDLGKKTPVLIVSALTGTDERVRGLRSGGDDYISKPFAFSELLAHVEALLRRANSMNETALLQAADLKREVIRDGRLSSARLIIRPLPTGASSTWAGI
jgi:two-component system, OmpR family, response regulator